MAPVILSLQARRINVEILYTGQHKETMQTLASDFQLNVTSRYLYDGPEISGIIKMIQWFFGLTIKSLFSNPLTPGTRLVLVHGDTLSTLLGAIIGKRYKVTVGHIEAGLRSFNLFHPFPEELTRLIVFRLTDISYCPGEWAIQNMLRYKHIKIDTKANTLLDSLRIACASSTTENLPDKIGVCSIHRFENIFSESRLKFITEEVIKATRYAKVIFVLHPATRNQLTKFNLLKTLESNPRLELVPRMSYKAFINLLRQSSFVITDGGGNQEELSYLKKTTILMRQATERLEGLGETSILSKYDSECIERAIKNATQDNRHVEFPDVSPSEIIAEHITGIASR